MTYEYKTELLPINEQAKKIIKPPKGEGIEFMKQLKFEYHPTTHQMMFCWMYRKATKTVYIGARGKWFVFTDATPENIGRSISLVVDEFVTHDYKMSKGCGLMTESIALTKLRFRRERTQSLH